MSKTKLSQELARRGFVNQTTFKDIELLDGAPITFYLGVDPSAISMTVGNLAAIMLVRAFAAHGHKPVLLVGGATGLIGDPDGKARERDLKTTEEVETNKKAIAKQFKRLLSDSPFLLVDNYDWFKDIGYLQFLRSVGKHVPMRQMLGRDFVQSRLGEDGSGISYAEFSYSLIQGYDFLHLFREHGVTLQLCGSDQWGNSIAGVELVRRIEGQEVNIWSIPLVINKTTGVKFGKSEDGAVWLDAAQTSPYKFYQFWLNCDDEGVGDYLKIYTELSAEQLADTMKQFQKNRGDRLAQKTLAYEVTKLVHGTEVANSVRRVSETLFGSLLYKDLSAADFANIAQDLPVVEVEPGQNLTDILLRGKLAGSKTEARRFLEDNAIYINGVQIPLVKTDIEKADSIHGYAILRRGRNAQVVLRFI